MNMICNSDNCINWYSYYFFKYGFCNSVKLKLRTNGDIYEMKISKEIALIKVFIKALFRTITNPHIFYLRGQWSIISGNKNHILNNFNIREIETIEMILKNKALIESVDENLFKINFLDFTFYIRRRVASDIHFLNENIANNQYIFLYPFIKDGVVLDIGANIGDTAIKFASLGATKVLAYEPHPLFYDIARKNIELNGMDRSIELIKSGIGKEDGSIEIQEDDEEGVTGRFGSSQSLTAKKVSINIINFTKILQSLSDIDAVKMDCEGAEFPAILNCPINVLRKVKAFCIEFHKEPLMLVEYLRKANYEVEYESKDVGLIFAKRIEN